MMIATERGGMNNSRDRLITLSAWAGVMLVIVLGGPAAYAQYPAPLAEPVALADTSPEPVQEREPDWKGIGRDVGYFFAYQTAAVTVLYFAPEGVSNWNAESKEEAGFWKWRRNNRRLNWDSDDLVVNYVGHPYFGAVYFVSGYERGLTRNGALGYSAMLSTLFEFGFEAFFEQPSIQDLLVTPIFGSVLGAYFVQVRDRVFQRMARQGVTTTRDKLILGLTDPMGSLNRKLDRWLGFTSKQGGDRSERSSTYIAALPEHIDRWRLVLRVRF